MEDALVPCPTCRRHHRQAEPDCPFCRTRLPRRAAFVAGIAAAAMSLSACYGAAPVRDERRPEDTAPIESTQRPG
jgi:hypothetical protein